MCLDALKNPVAAITKAKKKGISHAIKLMLSASLVITLALLILAIRMVPVTNVIVLLASVLTIFIFAVLSITLISLAVCLSATTLGGRGGYYEGLFSVSLSSLIMSVGILLAAMLLFVPYGMAVAIVIMMPITAVGFAVLYRSIKEMFRTDMITAFVTVSVSMLAIIVAVILVSFLSISLYPPIVY